MMLENILNELNDEIKKVSAELEDKLKQTLDFSEIERTLAEIGDRFLAKILKKL